jgi:hypothetical protein
VGGTGWIAANRTQQTTTENTVIFQLAATREGFAQLFAKNKLTLNLLAFLLFFGAQHAFQHAVQPD